MADGVEVVVGTYEEFLVGYKIKNNNGDLELTHSFATHAHTGSVKCVTCSGSILASGGADDKIVLHDMKSRTENKVLLHHNGTVNSVAFTNDNSHIFSAGSDGAFYALRTGSWQIEKYWPKAHKGSPITYISIHPSNKLALTIGDDHTLRTWNLIKGRQAYATNLKSKGAANPLSIVWSPEGQQFALTGYNDVSVWSVSNAAIEKVLKCPSKALCLAWISEKFVVVGLENGEIIIFNLEDENKYTFKGHNQRIKGIAYSEKYLYTASSLGDIIIWKFNIKKMKLTEKASVNTDCRITCLTIVQPIQVKKELAVEDVEEIEDNDIEIEESDKETSVKKRKINALENEIEEVTPKIPKIHPDLKSYVSVSVDDEDKRKKKKFFKNKNKNKNKKQKFKKSA